MGIDFAQSKAHWSYSGFNQFRGRLATQIGIDLNNMKGFGGHASWTEITDPIEPFLNHSDCDGQLSSDNCGKIGPRIIELVKNWPQESYDRQEALVLAEDMIKCFKRNHCLDFC
jgi:hypothetical protein